jgi:hypothetical protein
MQTFRCSSVNEIFHFYDNAAKAEVTASLPARHTAANHPQAARLTALNLSLFATQLQQNSVKFC